MTNYKLRKLICIECPKGCRLICKIKGRRLIKLSGNKCARGKVYAKAEIENPVRVLCAAAPAVGLELAVVPVKTDRPIPKSKIFDAMKAIKRIRVSKPAESGDVIRENIYGLKANLIATRTVRNLSINNINI